MPRDAAERIFVSYARNDGEVFARALREKLAALGFSLWHDHQDMAGGRDWWRQITEAIDTVEYLVLVMTPAALRSDIVRREWRYARQQGRCVVPVLGAKPLDFSSLPRWMARAHFYDLDVAEQEKRFVRQLESPCTTPRVPMMAPQPPADYVPRPDEFAALKAALLDARGEPVAITSALKGAGGYGKTTLAKALCADDAIQDAYHDGILWVTLGERPGEPQGRIEDLIHVLQGRRESFATRDPALSRLAEILADRRCLLVVDDVWHRVDAEPFLQAGPRCARLLTTRNADALPADAIDVRVDELTTDQAVDLLQSGLPPADQARLRRLAARLGEWPLLLKLANSALRERVNKLHAPLPDALTHIEKLLDRRGITAFDANNARARDEAVATTLDLSIGLLEPADRARLYELAVFPEDVSIPIGTVELLWHQAAELDELDTEGTLQRLFRLSLLLDLDLTERTIRLHDIIREYLGRHDKLGLQSAERDLVSAYRRKCGGRWSAGPDDGYYFKYLPSHLFSTDRASWKLLLSDYDWIRKKISISGIAELLTDYDNASDHDIVGIGRALRRSSHVIALDHSNLPRVLVREIGTLETDAARHLGEQIHREGGHAFDISANQYDFRKKDPADASSDIYQTIILDGGPVWAAATAPDGDKILAGFYDTSVRIVDLARGGAVSHLGHERSDILSAIILPQGKIGVTGTAGGILTVWDLVGLHKIRSFPGCGAITWDLCHVPETGEVISAHTDGHIRKWSLEYWLETNRVLAHSTSVRAVAYCATSKVMVTGDSTGELKFWDPISMECLRTLTDHNGAIWAIGVVPSFGLVISASDDGTLRLWDPHARESLGVAAETSRSLRSVCVAPHNKQIIVGTSCGRIGRCEPTVNGGLEWLGEHESWVTSIAQTSSGQLTVTASSDESIKVWDFRQRRLPLSVSGHSDTIIAVSASMDQRKMLTLSSGGTLKCWRMDDRRIFRSVRLPITNIKIASVSCEGLRAVTADAGGKLDVWDLAGDSAKHVRTLRGANVTAVALSADGKILVSGHADGACALWDSSTGAYVRGFKDPGHMVQAVLPCSDSGRLAVATSNDVLWMYDLRGGQVVWRTEFSILPQALAEQTTTGILIAIRDIWGKMEIVKIHPAGGGFLSAAAISRDTSVLACVGDDIVILGDSTGSVTFTGFGHGHASTVHRPRRSWWARWKS